MTSHPRKISIDRSDGVPLQAEILPSPAAEEVTVTIHERLGFREFDVCPICGDRPTDLEHVPPESIGGKEMTRTCKPCNNGLGRLEADLVDWFDNALRLPRFSSDTVRGRRSSSRILVRDTPDGESVFVIDGKFDPAVLEILDAGGQVILTGYEPDPNRVRLALLKSAYLAACLKFGVLQGEDAAQIRRDLVAARDAPSRDDVPESSLALGLTVLRLFEPDRAGDAPVITATADLPDGPCEGVVLAGRLFVSWSSWKGRRPPRPEPVRLVLDVAHPTSGTVLDVERW